MIKEFIECNIEIIIGVVIGMFVIGLTINGVVNHNCEPETINVETDTNVMTPGYRIGVDGKFGFGLGYNGIGYGTNIIKF